MAIVPHGASGNGIHKPFAMNRRQMVDECYAVHQDSQSATVAYLTNLHSAFGAGTVLLRYFRADCIRGDDDFAPIQRAILPSIPDAQPLRPLGEN